MAATTKLLQLRPKTLPTTTTFTPTAIHFSSSSSSSNATPDPNNDSSPQPDHPTPPPQKSQSPFGSYFSDLRASLKQTNPRSSISNQTNPPSKIESFEEIRRNLSEFRRRSAGPPPSTPPSSTSNSTPPPHSPGPISFQDLYQRNVASGGEGSTLDASKASKQLSFEAIRQSLRQLKSSSPVKNQGEGPGRMNDPTSLSNFKESLRFSQADPSTKPPQRVFGGSDHLPLSIFGPELKQKEEGDTTELKNRTEFLRTYGFTELGKMLRDLRPEKRDKKDWFSFEELNERLVQLREMEEKMKENDAGLPSVTFRELRSGLAKLRVANEEKASKSPLHRLDILGQLGRTPGYMLSPPMEELVEKYFHPDNMSASEKMKLELKKVRDEFKMSESDCGSARVQVAQLTTKIKHLSTALHKKDKHSRKGLQAMVQRRKKLLKYLRRTDWDSYCFVLSRLGLRDNPDYKC